MRRGHPFTIGRTVLLAALLQAAGVAVLAALLVLLAFFPANCVSACTHSGPGCLPPGCTSLFGYSTPFNSLTWTLAMGACLLVGAVAAAPLVAQRRRR